MKKSNRFLIGSLILLVLLYLIVFFLSRFGLALRTWAQNTWIIIVVLSYIIFVVSMLCCAFQQFKKANIWIGIAATVASPFAIGICLVTIMLHSLAARGERGIVVDESGKKYVICYIVDEPYGSFKYEYVNWFVRGNTYEYVE